MCTATHSNNSSNSRLSVWLFILFLLLPWVEGAIAQQAVTQTRSVAVELTGAERSWLAGNHTVRARVSNYPPYMLKKPEPSGIAVDYLSAVAKRYGFKVEFVPDTIGFEASVHDVLGPRQHFDLLLTFTRTPEREKQFAITTDYLTAPWVVYARRDSPYIIGLESLGGKTIAAEKGFVITDKIKSDFPAVRILEVAKTEDALLAVATGQADAYVGNLANASYFIKANRLDNLVVTAPTPYGINTQAMAVRKDWPELAGLINKGIAAMTVAERNVISQKWGAVEFKPQVDHTLLWQIVAGSSLIFLVFLYWNRKLAREIALRKQAELIVRETAAQLVAERDLLEERVTERTARLSEALEFNETILLNSPLPISIYAENGQCVLANEACAEFVGATREALLAQNFHEIPSWQRTTLLDDCLAALKLHAPQQREAHVVTSFGKDVWFEYRILPRQLKGQEHLLIQFVDLTERKHLEQSLKDSEAFVIGVLDSLAQHIAVIDGNGVIIAVNASWRRFAENNGIADSALVSVGVNYLEICAEACQLPNGNEAGLTLAGLRSVLAGESAEFSLEYPCHSPTEPRWFLMHVLPLRGQNRGAVMIHQNITERYQAEHKLRESEARYRMLAENITDVIWSLDLRTQTFGYISPSVERLRGYSADEVMQQPVEASLTPESAILVRTRVNAMLARIAAGQRTELTETIEVDQPHRNGHIIHTEVVITCLMDDDGMPTFIHGVTRDISARKQVEEKLRLAASVFTSAHEGILITGTDGTIIDVNHTFSQITGYSRDEALGRNPGFLSSGRHDQAFFIDLWRQLLDTGHWDGEIWNRHKNGEMYAEMLTISAVHDAQGVVRQYVGLFTDITRMKEHQGRLEHIAHYDALTNLPNRVLLADRLRQAMAQVQRRQQLLAVVFVDLDGFKAINDTHGHEAGDKFLVTIASRMKQALREGDTLARLGGDEFVAVLLDLDDVSACIPTLTRLLDAAAQSVQLGELSLQASASLGVTVFPHGDELTCDQLLSQADHAMYQAKLAGKNRYHLYDAKQEPAAQTDHQQPR